MKVFLLLAAVMVTLLLQEVYAITPVHIGKVSIDTSIYETRIYGSSYLPGPLTNGTSIVGTYDALFVKAYLKKNSNQFDLFSYSGKIGSSVVPLVNADGNNIDGISFSCYMLDDDDGWEAMVTYHKNDMLERFFKVYDDDGTEILADSGMALYAVDFNSTYIVANASQDDYDIWRFRTNISTTTPRSLYKTRAAKPSFMQIYGLSDGNYKVSLIPSSGNQVQFQMFDLMGRCIFSKQLDNLKAPATFTIPESNVPNSPFIAKVKDGNETLYKKQIPVK